MKKENRRPMVDVFYITSVAAGSRPAFNVST